MKRLDVVCQMLPNRAEFFYLPRLHRGDIHRLIMVINFRRCFDVEDNHHTSATLSLRRRQFIERCHEARNARYHDLIPEVSVKRTREELTKHAVQTLPLNRRLNVESGWSKVEEVRKKFEGAAASSSYSRSFESPPR
jgi:hypothetical protein